MTLKWTLTALLLYELLTIISPSITGVTYRDNFDFEQRYRDVNECNPFHWHPLHLPEMCADMFEKLIRSKIASKKPVRIMRERKGDEYAYSHDQQYTEYRGSDHDFPYPIYEIGSSEYSPRIYGKRMPLTPYEKMLELLKKDIKKDPSHPKIGVLPNLGPVAIYNQEISKKSETMIKDVATAYGKYVQASYADYLGYNNMPDQQLYVWDSHKNGTKSKNKHKKRKSKKDRVTRTKTKHGGLVTIIETLNPRKRRSAAYWLGS